METTKNYTTMFGNLTPTEDTLAHIEGVEGRGWSLRAVTPITGSEGVAMHFRLERAHGKENVFHYQLSATKAGGTVVGVNLYFVKNPD